MNKKDQIEMWHIYAIEEYDRIRFWARLIKSFVEYQRGSDSAIGIGMRRLSDIMVRTVNQPEYRNAILKEITDWAMVNMFKFHVEVSNAYATVYHLKKIKNLASDMVKAVAEVDQIRKENEDK